LLAALALTGFLHAPASGAQPVLAPARTVQVDGLAVNYTSNVTDPDAVTLVLVHGFGASLETWHDVYPALARQFQVARLDLKGHGFSAKPARDDYTWDEQARLVTAFIARLGLKRVVLVGHSLGGGIALLTCLQRQERAAFDIVGIVLISSAGYAVEVPFFIGYLRDPVARFFVYLVSPEFRVRFIFERVLGGRARITPERVHRYAYFLELPGSRNALERTAEHIVPANVGELGRRYRQIAVPALILWGENDNVIPVAYARRFNRELKDSRLTILPQTGHLPQEERPERVVEEIRGFVRALP